MNAQITMQQAAQANTMDSMVQDATTTQSTKIGAIKVDANSIEQNEVLKKYGLEKHDEKFRYMLLGRMQSDCEFYFGFGDKDANYSLWAKDEKKHIEIMRALWCSVSVAPEWLTMEQINEYAKRMNA